MNPHIEKRSCRRCSYNAPVTCACYNSAHYRHARISSHSSEGLCLAADFYLKPGACIYFRVEDSLKDKITPKCCRCATFRTTGLVEVKWCRENINGGGSFFTAGLKYYQAPYWKRRESYHLTQFYICHIFPSQIIHARFSAPANPVRFAEKWHTSCYSWKYMIRLISSSGSICQEIYIHRYVWKK